MSNQPDLEDIVDKAKDVERMRLMREQNDALQEMAGHKIPKGNTKEDLKLYLILFAIGIPILLLYFWANNNGWFR